MDDEGVIERLVSQLQAGTAGLSGGYKLSPIQFEKVGAGGQCALIACSTRVQHLVKFAGCQPLNRRRVVDILVVVWW
jgi:hypothetical protein